MILDPKVMSDRKKLKLKLPVFWSPMKSAKTWKVESIFFKLDSVSMIACEQIVLENKIDKITHKHLFFTINFFRYAEDKKKRGNNLFILPFSGLCV